MKLIKNDIFLSCVEEMLAEDKSVEMNHKGFSMRPFLLTGRDVILLSPIKAEELRRGMVVLFRYRNSHVLHRYRGRCERRGLKMVGDGNYRKVEWVKESDVLAYVSEFKRGEKSVKYDSWQWRIRSAWSLMIRTLRSMALYVKQIISK